MHTPAHLSRRALPENLLARALHAICSICSHAPSRGLERLQLQGVERGPSTPRSCPTRTCSATTRSACRPSRSTAASTGCPSVKCSRAGPAKVPDDFMFVLKASRRITHNSRLKESSYDSVDYLWNVATALGPHLGPILFPASAQHEEGRRAAPGVPRRRSPTNLRAAFEFRQRELV